MVWCTVFLPMDREAINPYLAELPKDILYHLGLDTDMDLTSMFGDTRFVCMGGEDARARMFAERVAETLDIEIPSDGVQPLGKTSRFELYKVGPVISVSHGMGLGSISILMNEITKLLYYAQCSDFTYIRIGTSGGIGIEPGTVVVTIQALNAEMQPTFEQYELGERRHYPTDLDPVLAKELASAKQRFKVVLGKTMAVDDFYAGQCRFDGALPPSYTKRERQIFWELAMERGVKNMEMEATQFAAFCLRAKIRAAIVCVALLDRLKGDQVAASPEELEEYSRNAQDVVLVYIKESLRTPAKVSRIPVGSVKV